MHACIHTYILTYIFIGHTHTQHHNDTHTHVFMACIVANAAEVEPAAPVSCSQAYI